MVSLVGWTQSFARTRMRPERIGTMTSGELGVKLSISSTWPNGGWCMVADPGMVREAVKLSKGGASD